MCIYFGILLVISLKASLPPAPVQHRPMGDERKGHEAIVGFLAVPGLHRCLVYADRRRGLSQRSSSIIGRTSFFLSCGGLREEQRRGCCGKASGRSPHGCFGTIMLE